MKKWIFSRYTVILLIVSVISLSAFKKSEDFELRKQIEIMLSIIKELKAIYVDEFGIADLMKKGMDAMLKSLDPYTVYYPETKIEDVRFMNSGKFGGIGILTKKVGVKFLVLDVLQGYSVHKSGVSAGDFITTVNGNSVANLTDEGFGELLQGSPGTTIELTVQKYSGEVVKLSPVREMVSIKSVPYYVFTADSVAYIKQTGFSETAAGEFETALKEMLAKKPKGIILDLRNNPGGLLIEAVKIVNFFVEQGVTVVSVRGKNATQSQLFKTEREPLVPKLPLVVLVNNGSASASEIIAGAIQDLDRGVIMGRKTFGKGLVQITRELPFNAILKLTSAKYYTPSDRCIQMLDYSHRNPDGSVGAVPDSLITKFKTKNGRTVYDGGGIAPDVVFGKAYEKTIVDNLLENDVLFNFASQYVVKNKAPQSPLSFKMSEKDFADFVEYATTCGYEYKTETTEMLLTLENRAKSDSVFQNAKADFEKLKQALKPNLKLELTKHKYEIIRSLEEEIVGRYFYFEGRLEYHVNNDLLIKKAAGLINNLNEYNAVFKVN